jgi:hypothetical protein
MPTIWASRIIRESIPGYSKSKYIDEIIIIDNNLNHQDKILFTDKNILQIEEGENTYVNPAWNKGVRLSKNDYVIFANDDLYIHDLDCLLGVMENLDWDLAGINLRNSNRRTGVEYRKIVNGERRMEGYGCFFLMKKSAYIQVPEEIKIWYGDDIQFDNAKSKYIFSAPMVRFELSKSINSDNKLSQVIEMDKVNYQRYIQRKT